MVDFYGWVHKDINELDRKIEVGEICFVFHVDLDLLNKAFMKLKNSYQVKFINKLEGLLSGPRAVVWDKGYVDIETENILTNPPIPTLE